MYPRNTSAILLTLSSCASEFGSEKRVGNVYSKASSFVDYIRRALRKLDLDDSKVSVSKAGNV